MKLAPTAEAELVGIAEAEGLSVSQLVAEALKEANRHGLDEEAEPFAAGERVLSVSLDPKLIRKTEARAVEAGVSFGAYLRQALGGYLVEEEDDGEKEDAGVMLLDRERRREIVAGAFADGLRWLPAGRSDPSQRRGGALGMCSTCRRILDDVNPDRLGHVACPYCGTYAPPLEAPPNAETRLQEEEAERQRRTAVRERDRLALMIRSRAQLGRR